MKPKKIGLLALALVLALGALGVGYASWTDSVTIDGSVNTGTLDLQIQSVSETWVYKVVCVNGYGGAPFEGYYVSDTKLDEPDCLLYVGSAQTSYTTNPDVITVTFDNLFPDVDFVADFVLHYVGTVPVKVNVATLTPETNPLMKLMGEAEASGNEYGMWIDGKLSKDGGTNWEDWDLVEGVQLHNCYLLKINIHVLLPQDNSYKGLDNQTFSGEIEVIQWNKYPE